MQKKKGISLIVLVITIIVMIILAASVVITLSNTGVIDKANQAVDLTSESQVQDLAALIWADAYMDDLRGEDLVDEVKDKLEAQGVKEEDWNITITDTGVTVTSKTSVVGLGSLISKDNYGDTVDYSVTVDGTTYTDWQIYYHNSDYIFLISANEIEKNAFGMNPRNVTELSTITVDTLSAPNNKLIDLYNIFRLGNIEYELSDNYYNNKTLAALIIEYTKFANTTDYATNVIGAIGGPTIELLAAGYNATYSNDAIKYVVSKECINTSEETIDGYYGYDGGYGYFLVQEKQLSISNLEKNNIYISNASTWLATPAAHVFGPEDSYLYAVENGNIIPIAMYHEQGIRPVVCLKASIPATVGIGDYDFSLVK